MERTISLIGSLDFNELHVRVPQRHIFLCGGRIVEGSESPSSVRDALLRHLPDRTVLGNANILLAERATDALPTSHFDNLLDLEELIAGIVDAVVLIVESPGAICELGVFAKTDEIRRKLIIIINNTHNNSPSFITLGPLRYIKDSVPWDVIHPFDWTLSPESAVVPLHSLDGMVTEISSTIEAAEKVSRFDRHQNGHLIYLTLAFCHLLRGAKLTEIKQCFAAAEINEVSQDKISKYLDILQICVLVERVANGAKNVHYVSLVGTLPIKVAFLAHIPNRDRNILRWIQLIANDIASEDPVRMGLFRGHNHAA